MEPRHSVNILFDGMLNGWFTSKALDDYIDGIDENDAEDLREFANARRVVNGTDKQVEIGKLALVFESALKAGAYGPITIPAPAPVPPLGPEPVQEAPMPAPKKDLSPVDETNKANKGAVGAAVGSGGVGAGIVYLWSLTSWFPAEWASDPQAIIFLTGLSASLFGTITAWVGAYRATDRRFMEEKA